MAAIVSGIGLIDGYKNINFAIAIGSAKAISM